MTTPANNAAEPIDEAQAEATKALVDDLALKVAEFVESPASVEKEQACISA